MMRIMPFLISAVLVASASASVPVRWTAETSRVQPIALDAWRGDTLDLECTLKSYGQQMSLGAATASLMWQTNGMGSSWWQTNATVSADGVIRATWSPSMDPGAPAVAFFLPVQTGDGASYRAAGTLRFRPSPGAGSQIAELPQPGGTLDFGEFNLVNAPWATLAAANEAISAAVTSATGALVIPPPVDLSPYATTGSLQEASTALSNDIQLAFNSSSNYTDQVSATLSATISSSTNSLGSVLRDTIAESAVASRTYADSAASNAQANAEAAASNYTDQVSATLSATISSSTNSLGSVLRDTIAESAAASRTYADGVASNAQRAAIAAIPSLSGYATEQYVSDAISAIDIPSMSGYATMAYADAVASNAQRSAIAAIPSLSAYATEQYVANYVASNNTPIDLSSYASRAYADAAASNAQAAAIAAIPSLSGYATETYAQNAAADAASDALSAAQSYARDLSWAASSGNTRLVSLDGTIWQDATGTVWQVSYIYGWSGTVIDLQTSAARPITFNYAGKTTTAPNTTSPTDYWSAGAGTNLYFDADMAQSWELWMTNDYHGATNAYWQPDGPPYPPSTATNLSFNTTFELYTLFYQPVALATNPVDHVLYEQSPVLRDIIAEQSTGTVARALTYGTPTRWTDATGCVWQVEDSIGGWMSTTSAVQFTSWDEVDPGFDLWKIFFNVDGAGANGYAYNPTGNTSYTLEAGSWQYDETDDYGDFDVTFVRPTIPGGSTNLVDRVLYEQGSVLRDIIAEQSTNAASAVLGAFASTGTVHAAESSTYASHLFDASFDAAYDATYLIRESTNAATAVSSSIVRYELATPGAWTFSDGRQYDVYVEGTGDSWYLMVSFDGISTSIGSPYSTEGEANGVLSFSFNASIFWLDDENVTATRALPGHLLDRAVNSVSITSITNITLPALSHPGQARDFILLLDIPSSVTNTVPAITNLLTFTASGAETVHYYVDGDDPSTATFPLPTSPGTWSYSFSEFKTSWFAVSLKPIVEAVAPGGAQ